MNTRQSQLLDSIIREYIETATPVGSSSLVSKHDLNISTATVRNEMAALEKQGYIYQPYTSAGRVPTEKGYKYFIEHKAVREAELDQGLENLLDEAFRFSDIYAERIKHLAKTVAEITNETVIVSFSAHDLYYTGISNLFRKPEFFVRGGAAFSGKNYNAVVNIAEVIDELDEAVTEFLSLAKDEPKVLIGKENPLSHECSAIITNINIDGQESVFGLLGLMRMDYQTNLAVIRCMKALLV